MHSRPEIHRTPTKFSELRYRPWSIDDYICSLNQLLERFRQADGDEAIEIVKDWIRLMNDFISNRTVNKIQYTRDIHDATVKKHRDVLARNLPRYHTANSKFEGEILIHPHRKQLEDVFGEQLFRTIASRQLSRGEEILEYRIREEEILLETDQLLGSSEIEEEERRARYGELFQETVELRTRMAQKMGSSDYSVFANELMGRSMTVSDKMDRFCEECADELIEVALEFRRRYRATFPNHKEGPGIPLDSDTMLENLGKVVCELFPEAEECYSFMQKYELMDIDYTSGKKPNTIECTYIANGNMPYLFVLMNPHSSKYLLLFHEFGHAIAHFCSGADELLPGCRFQPSDDLGELPSIALQILAIEPIVGIYPDKRVELEGRELLDQIRDLADNCLSREFCNFAYRRGCPKSERIWVEA